MRDTRLDAAVNRAASYRSATESRAEIDDLAVIMLTNDRAQDLTAEKQPLETDIERLVPILLAHLPSGLGDRVSGAVHQNIEPAEAFENKGFQSFNLTQFGQIAGAGLSSPAILRNFGGHRGQCLATAAADHKVSPRVSQPKCNVLSDGLGGRCDQRHATGKSKGIQVHIHPPQL